MAIGPVQLIVLGFSHPNFHGEIIDELERLHESDTIRVIDALAVHKDADGEIEVAHLSNLTLEEAVEIGSKVGALIGLGIEGEEGMEAGAVAGAEAAADGIEVFGDEDAWDVLADIPNDSAAALILIEHHWAVPLRDAIARAGGMRLSDGFISPLDLVAIGLMESAEAKELHVMETAGAASKDQLATTKRRSRCSDPAGWRGARPGGRPVAWTAAVGAQPTPHVDGAAVARHGPRPARVPGCRGRRAAHLPAEDATPPVDGDQKS